MWEVRTWARGDNTWHNHFVTPPEVDKTARKSRFWHVSGPKSPSSTELVWVGGIPPGGCGRVALGPGVIVCGKITLVHLQNLATRRGEADSGTFSDLNHLLDDAAAEGRERSRAGARCVFDHPEGWCEQSEAEFPIFLRQST